MNKDKTYTLVIADDHPLFRTAVRKAIETETCFKVLAEAGDGETALRLINDLEPDVAVLDIQMPKLSGLNVVQRLRPNHKTRVILLTMFNDQTMFLQAMDCGVAGYVLKDAAEPEIVSAIMAVANQRYYLSPDLGGLLLSTRKRRGSEAASLISGLTHMELKVLALIATLKSNQEIADALFISRRTVENHRVNIASKLNISGTNSLLKFAIHNRDLLPGV
jgi:two-component system, NarL family, response regulator DegU